MVHTPPPPCLCNFCDLRREQHPLDIAPLHEIPNGQPPLKLFSYHTTACPQHCLSQMMSLFVSSPNNCMGVEIMAV